ncbi:MAG TPA: hypothetical protein VGW75_01850 [Solirubrobacteraceae bacterium]|jgi:WD40 repeat protein|nr:hypothetical protein [Solirubrobacteraceae bacterium]
MATTPTPQPVPAAVRSRNDLEEHGVSFVAADSLAPTQLPIKHDGATYTMAQETRWLDGVHFGVGRWDGSLSIFSFVDDPFQGPIISTAASDPASEGVQMICSLGPQTFVTSSGDTALAVWTAADGQWRSISPKVYPYSSAFGAANSGVLMSGGSLLVVGHANGFMTTWRVSGGGLALQAAVNVQNPKPVNPWNLHNVRGVADAGSGLVVGGSEDGFLSVVYAATGAIVSQTVYNASAQRGINAIALDRGGNLLVANCAVGPADSNLWYFTLTASAPKPVFRSSVNLRVNPNAPQVFNFSTIWANAASGPCWFSSTEEGALWMGTVNASTGAIVVYGYETVTSPLGSALAYQAGGDLVLASYDIYEFTTGA